MPRDIQEGLNYDLDQCRWRNGELQACRYHAGRHACSVFHLCQDGVEPTGAYSGLLHPDGELRQLGKLFEAGHDPVGSWYLVKQQREWLSDQFHRCLLEYLALHDPNDRTIRILEAGVASFVHHYTYVRILADVLQQLDPDLRVALTVVDKCAYPIRQIAAVEQELADGLDRPKRLDSIAGGPIEITSDFLDVMNPDLRYFDRISTELWVRNLTEPKSVVQLGKFDLATEHFLTSVLDKRLGKRQFRQIRQSYASLLPTGATLLVAAGFRVGSAPFEDFVYGHRRFDLRPEFTLQTWDPYGLSREDLTSLAERTTPLSISLDNSLSVFQRR